MCPSTPLLTFLHTPATARPNKIRISHPHPTPVSHAAPHPPHCPFSYSLKQHLALLYQRGIHPGLLLGLDLARDLSQDGVVRGLLLVERGGEDVELCERRHGQHEVLDSQPKEW